jgi:hypothetical protein
MIARLLSLLGSLLFYFAVATLMAEVIMIGYFWSTWQMDRNKLIQILAVAQGVDLLAMKAESRPAAEEPSVEQPSYQQIVQARAMKLRNLELREQSLKNALAQLQSEGQTLAQQKTRYKQDREQYESQLATLEKGSQTAGLEENRGILAKLAPKQAKELLFQMLKKNEINDVVTLLKDMPEGSRAKILKEFKTPEESEKLDEVLRMIRQGVPQAALAKKAQDQIKQPKTPGP